MADSFAFVADVERVYSALMASPFAVRDTGLGGKLLYAGELVDDGRALVAAANIAGTATLAATADRAAQKQALRDGISDFLVNSLDEALRILKNQLRKRESVAVCVGLMPFDMELEMAERGVVPDLQRRDVAALKKPDVSDASESVIVTWSVTAAPAEWLPQLDAIAAECLDVGAWRERRWLRLAPRYLGRLAHGMRLIRCDRDSAARFVQQVRERVAADMMGAGVDIRVHNVNGCTEEHRFKAHSTG